MSFMNEGTTDRVIRVVLGVILLILGFAVVDGLVGTLLIVVGLVALGTGLAGYCLLYTVFGFRTNEAKDEAPAA